MIRILQAMIVCYQAARSTRPSPCRYYPTCSNYAYEAVSDHGAWRGVWLAIKRVGRCHPWADYGWDPVPLPVSSIKKGR